ncbi:MAG: putative tellurium resistance membrane protein TerC [Rhodothermales bacterium]|jgi:predicted tellurium resistance membrane protein TerC
MIELISDPQVWVAFLTLTALELVLGIDNIVFISILVDRLKEEQRELARKIGLSLAMIMRLGLLFLIYWIVGLTKPLIALFGNEFSGRDLILIGGGLFLLWKSTREIHHLIEGDKNDEKKLIPVTFASVITQIAIVDLVFSLDSIITAVGMVDHIEIMIAAVVASVLLMMVFAGGIGRFISAHPSIKVLALAFLIVIGVVLIADGFNHHVPKGYVYFAMAFAVLVEMLNIQLRRRRASPDKVESTPE